MNISQKDLRFYNEFKKHALKQEKKDRIINVVCFSLVIGVWCYFVYSVAIWVGQ